MRHLKRGKKLSRERNQRKALIKSLVSALIIKGRITTTLTKAKSAVPSAEKLVTKAKRGTLADRRQSQKVLTSAVAAKLFKEIGPRYATRKGGYTRILKLPVRKSDGAKMAILEFV